MIASRALLVVSVLLAVPAAPASGARRATVIGGAALDVVDLNARTAAPGVALSAAAQRVAIAPDARTAYVTLAGGCGPGQIGAIARVDPATGRLGAPIALGAGVAPVGLVVTPDGSTVFAGSSCDGSVVPVDVSQTPPVVGARAKVGAAPSDLAVAPNGRTLYVSNRGSDSLSIVDITRTPPVVRATVAGLHAPGAIAIDPDGSVVYVADTSSCEVTPIDGATRAARPAIALGAGCVAGPNPQGNPADIALTPDGSRLFASSPDAQKVVGIDLPAGSVRAPIDFAAVTPGPFAPGPLAFTPDDTPTSTDGPFRRPHLLVADTGGGGAVQIVDALAETLDGAPIVAGGALTDVAVAPDQPPVARFSVAPGRPGQPTRVDARASSNDEGAISSYLFNWGDGSSRLYGVPQASHVYARAGLYTVTLTEMNTFGSSTAGPFITSSWSTGGTLLRRGGPEARTRRTFVVGRSRVRPPVVGKRFVAQVTSGRVLVRVRGSRRFRALTGQANVAAGSELDTARGVLDLTVARDASGATDVISASRGRFVATQTRGHVPATTLRLSEALRCPRVSAAAKKKRRKRRRLHTTEDAGNFKTKGQYAATSVEGTTWDTTDACTSTRVDVAEGVVRVRDLVRRRTVTVRAGQSYTAKARP